MITQLLTGLTGLNSRAPIEIWRADLDALPRASSLACLSESEVRRAARFVFARDRRRYLALHVALRQLLSARTRSPAAALQITSNALGKPYLTSRPRCAFNLSRCHDVAVMAVADEGEIGIDLEMLRTVPDATELAKFSFTRDEAAAFEETPGFERDLAFLRGWTRKEACLKATGFGLSVAPGCFETGIGPDMKPVDITTGAGRFAVKVQSFCFDKYMIVSLAQATPLVFGTMDSEAGPTQ